MQCILEFARCIISNGTRRVMLDDSSPDPKGDEIWHIPPLIENCYNNSELLLRYCYNNYYTLKQPLSHTRKNPLKPTTYSYQPTRSFTPQVLHPTVQTTKHPSRNNLQATRSKTLSNLQPTRSFTPQGPRAKQSSTQLKQSPSLKDPIPAASPAIFKNHLGPLPPSSLSTTELGRATCLGQKTRAEIVLTSDAVQGSAHLWGSRERNAWCGGSATTERQGGCRSAGGLLAKRGLPDDAHSTRSPEISPRGATCRGGPLFTKLSPPPPSARGQADEGNEEFPPAEFPRPPRDAYPPGRACLLTRLFLQSPLALDFRFDRCTVLSLNCSTL
ncbi:hypothetical protein KM043_015298 [Ampulex compressa]|nr:hypothetical protein KM043_015298 [Ampulex compressa]